MKRKSQKNFLYNIASYIVFGLLFSINTMYLSAADFDALRSSGASLDPGVILKYKKGLYSLVVAFKGVPETFDPDSIDQLIYDVSGKIRRNHANIGINTNGVDCSAFDDATNVNDQLSAILSIFSTVNGVSYTSIADLLTTIRPPGPPPP